MSTMPAAGTGQHASRATQPEWHASQDSSRYLAAAAQSTTATTSTAQTANSTISSPSSTSAMAALGAHLECVDRPPLTRLLEAVDANDEKGLMRLLGEMRQHGIHLQTELNRIGTLETAAHLWLRVGEMTPLMAAAYLGHAQMVGILKDAGARIDQVDQYGLCALMHAARGGRTYTAHVLLQAGASVRQTDSDGNTALAYAEKFGHAATAAVLSKALAQTSWSFSKVAGSTWHVLTSTISTIYASRGKAAAGSQVEPAGQPGLIMLLEAVEGNDAEALIRALDEMRRHGMDLAGELNRTGRVHDTVSALRSKQDYTPLMTAAVLGHTQIAGILLEAGARVDQAGSSGGSTAVMGAVANGHADTLQMLLQAGATVSQADLSGMTALMLAALKGGASTVHALLQASAKVDQINANGMTALMCAAGKGQTSIVQMLLQAGANVNQADVNGNTALAYAEESGHAGTVEVLRKAGAKKAWNWFG